MENLYSTYKQYKNILLESIEDQIEQTSQTDLKDGILNDTKMNFETLRERMKSYIFGLKKDKKICCIEEYADDFVLKPIGFDDEFYSDGSFYYILNLNPSPVFLGYQNAKGFIFPQIDFSASSPAICNEYNVSSRVEIRFYLKNAALDETLNSIEISMQNLSEFFKFYMINFENDELFVKFKDKKVVDLHQISEFVKLKKFLNAIIFVWENLPTQFFDDIQDVYYQNRYNYKFSYNILAKEKSDLLIAIFEKYNFFDDVRKKFFDA